MKLEDSDFPQNRTFAFKIYHIDHRLKTTRYADEKKLDVQKIVEHIQQYVPTGNLKIQ